MTGTPAVAWFREHVNMKEWIPEGPRWRVLVGPDGADETSLAGIDTAALTRAALELLGETSR